MVSIKDAKGRQDNNGGILNHTEGDEKAEPHIDKPSSLRMPTVEDELIKGANLTKDARVPSLENSGTLNRDPTQPIKNANGDSLKECIHGLLGGKNCYLCDPDHPYRQRKGMP
jgi:hypothetical protein